MENVFVESYIFYQVLFILILIAFTVQYLFCCWSTLFSFIFGSIIPVFVVVVVAENAVK